MKKIFILCALLTYLVCMGMPVVFAQEQADYPAAPEEPAAISLKSPPGSTALVKLFNRPVAILRGEIFGYSPQERVKITEETLAKILQEKKTFDISIQESTEGKWILIDGSRALLIIPDDADAYAGQTLEDVVNSAVRNLHTLLEQKRRQGDPKYIMSCLLKDLGLLIVLGIAAMLILHLELALISWIARHIERMEKRRQAFGVDIKSGFLRIVRWLIKLMIRLILFVALYMWFTFVFSQFLYTRTWAENLKEFFLGLMMGFGRGFMSILPNLFIMAIIVFAARALSRFIRNMFLSMQIHGRYKLAPEAALPTSRIIIGIIWIAAAIMIYPYLPGSDSAAFKSIGVFIGLLITLGGTTMVGQVLGGFLLMYSKEVQTGDYINVEGTEGTVENIGFFFTKIRTVKNEGMIFPNLVLIGKTIRNYSGRGEENNLIVHTSVTIGYNAPWRQVHAMLKEAADTTPGLRKEPRPFIWQRKLSDFYVEYELNAFIETPKNRVPVLSTLHANIQDMFNKYGVQIMSPHYERDPAQKVWVPEDKWHEPPAKKSSELVDDRQNVNDGKE